MTIDKWKPLLIPAGVLLICYVVAPGLVKAFMGSGDAMSCSLSFSLIAQAGLGIALSYKLFGLKQPISRELASWLDKFSQPPEKARELSEKVALAAVFLLILAIAEPLAGEIITSGRLLIVVKTLALVYAGCLGYKIWKLAEPFMSYVPAPAPPEVSEAPQAAPASATVRRCGKCGQPIDASMKSCASCGHPIE